MKIYKYIAFNNHMESFYKIIIFSGLSIFIIAYFFVFYTNLPSANDLALDKDSDIYSGEGEVCLTPYSETKCEEGLECILISKKPQKNGVCMKPGFKYEEDFINRNHYANSTY